MNSNRKFYLETGHWTNVHLELFVLYSHQRAGVMKNEYMQALKYIQTDPLRKLNDEMKSYQYRITQFEYGYQSHVPHYNLLGEV